jgi:hypothetical protein
MPFIPVSCSTGTLIIPASPPPAKTHLHTGVSKTPLLAPRDLSDFLWDVVNIIPGTPLHLVKWQKTALGLTTRQCSGENGKETPRCGEEIE